MTAPDKQSPEALIRSHNVEVWERGGLKLRKVFCLTCRKTFQEGTHWHDGTDPSRPISEHPVAIKGLRYE